ncbi:MULTISPECIES: type VI secretion system baseplate subunit TssF [unclassified Caballeronia]|uniref:type VI secretion system baseplate subunit TssF n=1 Tax=unclassified Caballeronia TaxID=2646786 RepID=UPI002863AF8C|nr:MULTISPECIES: type VI secretion system baseplate subunit TssF [unclassified Caballeronia]MDR5753446.1 type VI secretion system baseplate subunit TssF [Caballeronia sp. LZ024]MDR5841184.1 type VI secretion system baseplate subunit TssF [Caballeronia sp. LZ031]
MDDSILRYYEAEMRYLSEAGKEFAAKKSMPADKPLEFELVDRELVAVADVPRTRPER